MDVVKSKFYMLRSNVYFMLGEWEKSKQSAESGLAHVDKVMSMEPDILKAMKNTTRDLYNNRIRCIAKLTGKSTWDVREANPIMSQTERM